MNADPNADASGESRLLEQVLAEYLAAEDAGTAPPIEAFIARHPGLAPALGSFFADRELLREHLPMAKRLDRPDEPPGQPSVRYFGDYELIEVLGQGGMGVVYKARQRSLDRLIALKMINFGRLADADAVRRFRNEAEAVARLDHPSILKILEVGEHDGCRYFSMPLVAGGSLAASLQRLSRTPRLAALMMLDIAAAVHHAHQRGILHRDLKPANILLDGEGRPHVADFGLAKNLNADVAPTLHGIILGTPAYMAPEQASGRSAATTASDVYGLGAILYATLTGRSPFPGDSPAEILRQVCHASPDRPLRLNPLVDRDLETICLRCLEKEPERRYSSARELGEDLSLWLQGRPIAARPVGALAKARLWCRRSPALACSIAALGLTLALGSAGMVMNWLEVRHQRALLEQVSIQYRGERDAANALNDFLVKDLLARSSPLGSSRRDVTVAELLDRSAEAVKARFPHHPAIEASVHQVLADSYRALGQLDKADAELAQCLRLHGPSPADKELALSRTWHSLAGLRLTQGRAAEASANASRAFSARCRALGPADPASLESANLLAVTLRALGKADQARSILTDSLELAGQSLDADHRTLLALQSTLAVIEFDRHQFDRAERRLRLISRSLDRIGCDDRVEMIFVLANLGAALCSRGETEEAGRLLRETLATSRRVLGYGHDVTLTVSNNLAVVLDKQQRFAEAGLLLEEVVQGRERLLGGRHVETLRSMVNLAANTAKRRRYDEAATRLRGILPDLRTILPTDDPALGVALLTLADSLRQLHAGREAEGVAEESIRFYGQFSPRGAGVANAATLLGSILLANRKLDAAERVVRGVIELHADEPQVDPWRIASAKSLLGEILSERGDREVAGRLLLEGFDALRRTPGSPTQLVEEARGRVQHFQGNASDELRRTDPPR